MPQWLWPKPPFDSRSRAFRSASGWVAEEATDWSHASLVGRAPPTPADEPRASASAVPSLVAAPTGTPYAGTYPQPGWLLTLTLIFGAFLPARHTLRLRRLAQQRIRDTASACTAASVAELDSDPRGCACRADVPLGAEELARMPSVGGLMLSEVEWKQRRNSFVEAVREVH